MTACTSRSLGSFSWLQSLLTGIALGLALGWAVTSGAESLVPASGAAATVRLGAGDADVALTPGQHVVFQNDSSAIARVELDLGRGEGIACSAAGEPTRVARKFVVAGGSALDCESPVAPVAYRVFQSAPGGDSRVRETSGRIEPGGVAPR